MKLYTLHCPKCEVLKNKLTSKNITFTEISDEKVIADMGFETVPQLELDNGEILDFNGAIKWLTR